MKIKIETYRSSYRLRFTYPKGSRNTITVAPATKAGYVKAQQVAQFIELDILNNSFNKNKYSFTAKVDNYNIVTLWEQYKEIKQSITSITTQLESWEQTNRCLSKLPSKLLELDQIDRAIAALLKLYSIGTLERTLANLKAACNVAVEKQQIKNNPYKYYKLPKRQKPIIECFNSADINIILNAFADYRDGRFLDYVTFLALTFCRPEEALALSSDDISTKTISFNKAYSRATLKSTKNNRVRLFPINDQLAPLAVKLAAQQKEALFVNTLGNRLDHRSWSRDVWKPVVSLLANERSIEKYLKCYCLRHSGITRCIQSGLDIATVARLAGSSSEIIYKHYLATQNIENLTLPEI